MRSTPRDRLVYQDAENRLKEAYKTNPLPTPADVASSKEEWEQWIRDFQEEHRPPVRLPERFLAARQVLVHLSLLAVVRFAEDDADKFLVHRWTARALAQRMNEADAKAAHESAAAYWLWRGRSPFQLRENVVADWLEARHHLLAAGDLAKFHEVSFCIILQLQTWGAWDWEEQLLRETLAVMPETSSEAGALLNQLGIVAHRRGDFDAVLDWTRKSLGILEQRGDRAGMAKSYHLLGMVAQDRGDLDSALDWYRKCLAIFEELGDRASMAKSYHQLGRVAQERGDTDAALDSYRKSLAISEQLGDRGGMAYTYGQLGTVAQMCGDTDAALDWYRKCLAISEQLGDRLSMANSYQALGMVAQHRGDYDSALEWYRKGLAILERLGDRAGMARTLSQIGILYAKTGKAAEAVPLNLHSLGLRLELQVPEARIDLHWLSR